MGGPSGTGIHTLVVANRRNLPPQEELRRLVAADAMPDGVSAEDAVGATVIDDRYFSGLPGLGGCVLRWLPLGLAQAVEVVLSGSRCDAIVTWSDRPAIVVGTMMRLWRRRPAHVAILLWPSRPHKAAALRIALPGIDRLIAWPPLQRQFLHEQLGIPAEHFADVRAPVDTTFWRPMSGQGDLICSVGQEMRDYGTLLEALTPLDIHCHIAAGTGIFNTSSDKWWKASVGRRPLPASVTVGKKSFLGLRDLYARARFVVVPLVPSDMDNGITTILEAFAMGKAVICTESAGQVGVLEAGVNCLRVPPFDPVSLREAIIELWGDPEKCARFGAAGRELVVARHGLEQWRAAFVPAVRDAVAARAAADRRVASRPSVQPARPSAGP